MRPPVTLSWSTCYSPTALYKTQFAGVEFFNGFRWSNDLAELKFIIERDKKELHQHLLETEEYRKEFYGGDLAKIADASGFKSEGEVMAENKRVLQRRY